MTDTSALRAEFEKFWEAERQRTWDAAGMPSHRGSTPSEAWGSSFKEHTWTGFQAAHSIRNAEVERLKADAERLDWLDANSAISFKPYCTTNIRFPAGPDHDGLTLREFIDAALSAPARTTGETP